MTRLTIDDLVTLLTAAGVDAALWRRWVEGDGADAALVRDALAATEALLRGEIDRAGYDARMAELWRYWRSRLDALPADEDAERGRR